MKSFPSKAGVNHTDLYRMHGIAATPRTVSAPHHPLAQCTSILASMSDVAEQKSRGLFVPLKRPPPTNTTTSARPSFPRPLGTISAADATLPV